MIHHDSREYNVAVSDSAKEFQRRLDERFHLSVPRVERVIEQVQNDVPQDMIVAGKALRFESGEKGLAIITPDTKADALAIHPHALRQAAERVNFPGRYLTELQAKDWGKQLIAHNLTELYGHLNGDRFLLRNVKGETRGFLSDHFRRLDSRPLLEAFVGAIRQYGARPIDGFALQTKIKVRCFLPYVFEPFPGELVAIGAELGDSDFGDGYLTLSLILERMWCTNLATLESVLKQVHLGKRLPDNVRLSERTYALDTQTMASAIKDLSENVLGPGAVNQTLGLLKAANEEKIATHDIQNWVKKNLNKEEGVNVVEKFASPDIELLPAGQTKWRWSNALSWLSNETQDEHRKLELQEYAGEVVAAAQDRKQRRRRRSCD